MKTPAEKFLAAHRKIERDIIAHSEGGDRENSSKLSAAINRLDDLTNDPELRGGDRAENDARSRTVSFLRKAKLAADDAAREANAAGRNKEIARLSLEARQQSHARDRDGGFDVHGVGYGDKYRVKR